MTSVTFVLNGVTTTQPIESNTMLCDLLRYDMGLTGTKVCCSIGVCGACSVLINGKLMSSCLTLALRVENCRVLTIEGIAGDDGSLSEVQRAFIEAGGFQCGACTSGQIIAATALLESNAQPNSDEIKEWMMGNLCRCTGYYQIIDAIKRAAAAKRATV